MKTSVIIISTLILISWVPQGSSKENIKSPSFSYKELESAEKVPIPSLQYIEASDKIRLAYREYKPKQIAAILIFYHGGGTYSAGGYQYVGNGLSQRFNILVITPDLRGHGDSGGEEGDAPSPEQVLDDIGVFIRHMKSKYLQKPVLLGGHSSGGGMILNYSSYKKREKVQGYVFISPHLGFRSKTEIENPANPFATVKTDFFVQNVMYGTHGNSKAVFFNYSKEVLQNTKNIGSITVNMSNAQTPTSPKEQLQELDLPTAVWIGKEDEVLDAVKVISFFKENNPQSYAKIIEGEKHLSILLTVSNAIGSWLSDIIQ
jgi:alpha-beta hydrolase superfamily lysophospholipase